MPLEGVITSAGYSSMVFDAIGQASLTKTLLGSALLVGAAVCASQLWTDSDRRTRLTETAADVTRGTVRTLKRSFRPAEENEAEDKARAEWLAEWRDTQTSTTDNTRIIREQELDIMNDPAEAELHHKQSMRKLANKAKSGQYMLREQDTEVTDYLGACSEFLSILDKIQQDTAADQDPRRHTRSAVAMGMTTIGAARRIAPDLDTLEARLEALGHDTAAHDSIRSVLEQPFLKYYGRHLTRWSASGMGSCDSRATALIIKDLVGKGHQDWREAPIDRYYSLGGSETSTNTDGGIDIA